MARIHDIPSVRATGAAPVPSRYRQRGVTLIELVTVMTVLGILAAIAIPSYSAYTRRAHRAAAQAFLLDIGARQQQWFVDRRTYAADLAALGMSAPDDVATYYDFAVDADGGPPPTFTATATPKGPQADDTCASLSIDQDNGRSSSNPAATDCW